MPLDSVELHRLLKKHWGYAQFRGKQESIIQNILEGRDVAVIMPTGGGKSLCYQLPAVAMERTCVVVSPLIALMQDQAAQLQTAGIPAAFLNSSLSPSAQRETLKRAQHGELRLLYLSPERLVRDDTLDWLDGSRWGFSPSTRRTASPNGDTNSGRNTGGCARCANGFPRLPLRRSRPARRERCGTIFWRSSICAIRRNS